MQATTTYRIVAAVLLPVVRMLFRPQARGLEHVAGRAGYVLAPNQLSNLDGFAVGPCLFPRQVRWMGKAELFNPFLAPLLRRLGIFPVRRGRGDVEAIATAVAFARAGHAVGIFPEGTRRRKGIRKTRAPRAHTGAARVALAAGVPLVPTAIAGTDRLLALRRWQVAFGAPVSTAGLDANERIAARELTTRLMAAISELESGLRADRVPPRLHPRHLLDIGVADLARALGACFYARRRRREERVLRAWTAGDTGLVSLSVRSAFDLLLQALDLRAGDEIVCSAVTHPDMARIAKAHGLRVLSVDIETTTLAPRLEVLARAIGPRTRVVLVAHLFGSRVDLEPIAALVRPCGILLVEDCAQSYRGPDEPVDACADVSLYSFGSIKTATALGGALVHVADSALCSRMQLLQERWPVQPRSEYLRRVLKLGGLVLLGRPRAYSLLARGLARAGRDLDTVVNGAVRGFPGDLTARIRRRPSAPLLALLERRFRVFDGQRLERRTLLGEQIAAALSGSLELPGRAALGHTHWVLPVVSPTPERLVAMLRASGFDAARKTSAIAALQPPADRLDLVPENALRMLEGIVFLPAYPELGRDADRLIDLLS